MQRIANEKVDEFFSRYRQHQLKKGQGIIFSGENVLLVYKLDKGRIGQYSISDSGQKTMLNVFKPPSFLPMSFILRDMPSPHFFEAMTDCVVRTAPAEAVRQFLLKNNEVMYDLLTRLYSGIDGLQDRMMLMATGGATSRVLLELVISTDRFGEEQSNNVYILPMTETELALSAGLSRETVSREISKLKDIGLVEISHNEIRVPDYKALITAAAID
jgi:CRP/FNR family transcriptional regulator